MSGIIEQISIKEYDTVAIVCAYLQDNGLPIDLSGVKVIASMRQIYGNDYIHFRVEKEPLIIGRFVLRADADYIPQGLYKIDVLFENELSSKRIASDTFELLVKPAITQPVRI